MDKMTFASYRFEPSDVIEGLNRYFAETKANRYLRVSLEIRRGVCYNNPDCVKDIIFTNSPPDRNTRSGYVCWNYYLICDPEEVVGVAINWLREEHDIFYTPGMEVPKEDRDIFCKENLDTETVEKLRTELVEARRMYHKAIEERNQFGKRLADIRKASGMADENHGDLVEYIATIRKCEENYEHLYKQYEKMYCELRDAKFTKLSEERDDYKLLYGNLKSDILELYREIFDCSNGDPEGTDAEVLQDILTEYKRTLALKNTAEEKTIKYKELARENEEKANKYKDTADKYREMAVENRIQWNNTNLQLQWAQEENRKLLEKYEKLKNELDEMTKRYGGSVMTSGGLCEDLSKERERTKRLEQKLIEIRGSHEKLCKDYTELRKAIWEAMDRKPETLPEEDARLAGEARMLQLNYKSLLDLLVNYGPAQKILSDISEFRKWAIEELKQYGIVVSDLEHPERIDVTGSDIFRKLLKRYDWAYGSYKEQHRLRQYWHSRWKSENERANGEHKRAEKLRKEVTALANHIELLKLSNASQANSIVASQAFKNECRKLKEEKTKVISALGQDIWDDCLK